MNSFYLLIDLIILSVPLALSFGNEIHYFKKWKFVIPASLITVGIFLPLEIWFVKNGIKGYNPAYLLGPEFSGIPLEDLLYLFIIGFAFIFAFEAMRHYLQKPPFPYMGKSFSVAMAILLIPVAIFNPLLYTSTIFLILAGLLLVHQFIFKTQWMGYFHLTFLLILPPMGLIRTVMTGTLIKDHVIWFSDDKTLGDRLFNLPIESLFYGVLQVLVAVTIYELLKTNFQKKPVKN